MSRILWVGDAVASTGFSKCTHYICDHLHSLGHEILVLGINYYGQGHSFPYEIQPCYQPLDGGTNLTGEARLPWLIVQYRPDVVVILQDPWNIKGYFDALDIYLDQLSKIGELPADFTMPTFIGWLAVDAKNQKAAVECNRLDHVVCWTQFGIDEMVKGGYKGPTSLIGCGVDTSIYYPRDKAESRRKNLPFQVPADAFIIGVVGRNQHRKRIDLSIRHFAEWVRQQSINNAWLFLHTAPTGEDDCDIVSLARYYGVSGRVIWSMPKMGSGHDENTMAEIYSMMDVYLTTTQGEGFGLPALEAMACGTPVIAPNWSALGEWVKGSAVLVDCCSTGLNSPIGGVPYTIGGVINGNLLVKWLDHLYRNQESLDHHYKSVGLRLATSVHMLWKYKAEQWARLVFDIEKKWSGWSLRQHTMDRTTVKDVYIKDSYNTPANLTGYTVVDVGANIGAFSRLCLERGADLVVAIEPDEENYAFLESNLASFGGQVQVLPCALVGDLFTGSSVALSMPQKIGNFLMTGGQNIFEPIGNDSQTRPVCKFADLPIGASSRILLKLDCEGSEYQILFSDLPWERIDLIVGESHPVPSQHPFKKVMGEYGLGNIPTDHESLVSRLESVGYCVETVDYYKDKSGLLNFRAERVKTRP